MPIAYYPLNPNLNGQNTDFVCAESKLICYNILLFFKETKLFCFKKIMIVPEFIADKTALF